MCGGNFFELGRIVMLGGTDEPPDSHTLRCRIAMTFGCVVLGTA